MCNSLTQVVVFILVGMGGGGGAVASPAPMLGTALEGCCPVSLFTIELLDLCLPYANWTQQLYEVRNSSTSTFTIIKIMVF